MTGLPTFLCIGAQKSGTTWLARMVAQHPQVTVGSRKELHFFNKSAAYARGLDWYREQFSPGPDTVAVGEFTPNYFWTTPGEDESVLDLGNPDDHNPEIPRLVREAIPDARLVVLLRNPVERAISAYYHMVRKGRVKPRQRLIDVADAWGIESMGYYDVHLENWLEEFPRDRFLVLFYEEALADAHKRDTLVQVYEHIGVDPAFVPEDIHGTHNVRGTHFDMRVNQLPVPTRLKKLITRRVPRSIKERPLWHIDVSDEDRAALAERFRPHTARLEEILGRPTPWP